MELHGNHTNRNIGLQHSRGTYSQSTPHQQSIGYRNFDQVGTNSDMTHVMILSTKLRRNEQLRQTLDIGNMF